MGARQLILKDRGSTPWQAAFDRNILQLEPIVPNATLAKNISVTIGGLIISGVTNRSRSGESALPTDVPNMPTAKSGTLTTRTDNDTGVATLAAGHGIVTNDVVDVYWDGGVRYGMTATVATNAVTVDGGAGDNLPVLSTVLSVSKRQVAEVSFDPTLVTMLAAKGDGRISIRFMATAVVALALDLAADEVYSWVSDDTPDVANPLGTDPITAIHFSNGNVSAVNRLKTGILFDSVA